MCDAMDALPGHNIVDALYAGFQVAFNHTGKAKCWDWSTSSAHSLGSDAWDFQAGTNRSSFFVVFCLFIHFKQPIHATIV
jgi:hypothetical protein